ncbi:hypothetical protein ZYGR_0N02790 [Zygosaccharomyces rouxii]|uniref:BHLH domain-containing protein n=1 Tax=Zygosaccharomyces rouxii TaxID=4956 RepID=A0A1Q2ZZL4_ZYGRO|nr:hypothetical protein ZYGR_0N02790 [Zygosaccharomyces rouxii]
MESVGGGGGDMFDLFDLDNDNDIDFETAYKMISNFDDVASSGEHDELLPRLGFGDLTDVETQFGLNNNREDQDEQQQHHQQHEQWSLQPHHEQWPLQLHPQPSHAQQLQNYQDFPLKQQRQQQQSDSLERNAETVNGGEFAQHETGTRDDRPQLLSAYESNAIEHFLDSLISHNHAREKEEQESLKRDSPAISTAYRPPTVEIPEITIGDSDIPAEIRNDPSKVKKWKHVEIERIRRNQIKKTFDELIGMTRYPRGSGNNKIVKPKGDKRVPKHTLLSYVVEDIRSIIQANEKLETMLRDITNIKKEDVSI